MKRVTVLLCLAVLGAAFSSASAPKKRDVVGYQIVFDHKYYEDDKIRVNNILGSQVFYLSIENKTRNAIILDTSKLAFVSYGGEVLLIAPDSNKKLILARSKVVFSCDVPAIIDSFDQGSDSGSHARDWQDY